MDIIKDNNRFFIPGFAGDDDLAQIEFSIKNGIISINHTEVSSELKGQGIAAKLTEKVIDLAKENEYKIHPVCSYAVSYFEKHETEYSDLIV
jgi:predicted GNAT family acetyltransferase